MTQNKNMSSPLEIISEWIASLSERERFWMESEIACRAELAGPSLDDYSALVDQYFRGTSVVFLILSRTITVRAIVDWHLWTLGQTGTEELLLDAVEMASPFVKSHAIAALSTLPELLEEQNRTRDTWLALRQGPLSDTALLGWKSKALPSLPDYRMP